VHLPLLCASAVAPDAPPPLDLAAATTLLWTGLELYDDQTDGDLALAFRDRPASETTFAAFALSCVLPPALLAELPLPEAAHRRVQRLLSGRLLQAFAGQQADLAHVGRDDVATGAVEAAVRGKNGAASALFSALGAVVARAPEAVVDAYARYGEELGIVAQYQSDFWELFFDPGARDLVQGNRTLQIAAALELAPPGERGALTELLDRARTDPSARDEVRDRLRDGRCVARWRRAVHGAAEAALAALDAADPHEPAAGVLRDLVRERTPFC
jgi:geranylgeranyl pyrophosphate synthase